MLSINKTIYSILSSNTDITNKIEQNLFPILAPKDTSLPTIIYSRIKLEPTDNKDLQLDKVYVQIDIFSNTYSESIEIAENVRACLESYRSDDIRSIKLYSADEDVIDGTIYNQELIFKIE